MDWSRSACAGLAAVTNAMPGASAAGASAVTRLQVVEDDAGVRQLVCEMLSRLGYRTLAAEDARQVLAEHADAQAVQADADQQEHDGRDRAGRDVDLARGASGQGGTLEGSVQAAISRPFADEFRVLEDNTALLTRIAKAGYVVVAPTVLARRLPRGS